MIAWDIKYCLSCTLFFKKKKCRVISCPCRKKEIRAQFPGLNLWHNKWFIVVVIFIFLLGLTVDEKQVKSRRQRRRQKGKDRKKKNSHWKIIINVLTVCKPLQVVIVAQKTPFFFHTDKVTWCFCILNMRQNLQIYQDALLFIRSFGCLLDRCLYSYRKHYSELIIS